MSAAAVFIADPTPELRLELVRACEEAGPRAVFVASLLEAHTKLLEETPSCIFVDAESCDVESLVSWVRSEGRLFAIPVVAVVPEPSDALFRKAHRFGADDVIVRGDSAAVQARLANLEGFDPATRPPITRGQVVVAYPAGGRRAILGRILRQSGFEVSFAEDADELREIADRSCPSVLIAKSDLPPRGAFEAATSLREQVGEEIPMVALRSAGKLGAFGESSTILDTIAIGSDLAPPDHLLFLANELLSAHQREARTSARLLFGSMCSFRAEGERRPVYGLTYNLSREGLYVRTLDPPQRGARVWLEMRPPHVAHTVHLRGEVAWRKGLQTPGGAAPAGFGVRLSESECPPADLSAYQLGYDALLREPALHHP
ncbi:MAG: PilZ domain-containing protein [Myxococcales bacterium]|nr:PilZ domain-containing protein [Myxococcales bacterium]